MKIHSILNQKDDFNKHWQPVYEQSIPENKILAARKFLQPLYMEINRTRKLNILDAGCGDGVHASVIEEINKKNSKIEYCGIDLSMTALKIARARTIKNKHFSFQNTDIGRLPFKNCSFDVTFSYGVLAYSNNPTISFGELSRVTKKDGIVGIWIFPKIDGFKGFIFNIVRKLCQMTGTTGTRFIANLIVPFLGFLPTSSKMNLLNSTWGQCREIVLVNIAPKQLFFLSTSEVEKWFMDNNFEIINMDLENPISIWGRKQ